MKLSKVFLLSIYIGIICFIIGDYWNETHNDKVPFSITDTVKVTVVKTDTVIKDRIALKYINKLKRDTVILRTKDSIFLPVVVPLRSDHFSEPSLSELFVGFNSFTGAPYFASK